MNKLIINASVIELFHYNSNHDPGKPLLIADTFFVYPLHKIGIHQKLFD